MKNAILLFALVGLIGMSGCRTAHRMNKVSVGMTKAEVIKEIGKPSRTSAQGGVEILVYDLNLLTDMKGPLPFFVRLIDGKVEAYGEKGDFDSTVQPKQRIEIEVK